MNGSSVQIPGGVVASPRSYSPPPGVIGPARILAAAALGIPTVLQDAEYTLSAPLAYTPAHKPRIIGTTSSRSGRQRTRLKRGFTAPSVGLADDPTNNLVSAQGTLDTALCNTTLATTATGRSTAIVLTAPITINKGQYLRIRGNNNAFPEADESDGASVIYTEIVQAAANVAAGTTIQLAWPTMVHHASGVAVVGVEPVTDFEFVGVDLEGDGDTVAAGLYLQHAVGGVLDMSGAGYSHALVRGYAVQSLNVDRLYGRGENNSLLYLYGGCHEVELDHIENSATGLRNHANGIPRGLVNLRDACSHITAGELRLSRGVCALRTWGTQHFECASLVCSDIDMTLLVASATGGSERDTEVSGVQGAYDGGCFALPTAAFSLDVKFGSMSFTDCGSSSSDPEATYACYIHDTARISVGTLSCVNNGVAGVTRQMNGVCMSDALGGQIGSVVVRGCLYGLRTRNITSNIMVGSYDEEAIAGSGLAVSIVQIGSTGGSDNNPTFGRMRISSADYMRFDWGTAIDWNMRIDRYQGSIAASDVIPAYNNTGISQVVGDLVTLDPASPAGKRYVKASASGDTACAVVVVGGPSDIGTGTVMIAILPNRMAQVMCTMAAVAVGDILVASATASRAATANSTTDPKLILGKAITNKAAGSEGLVTVVPV